MATSSSSQLGLSQGQNLCWHCEEAVSASASSCPYCRKSLKNASSTVDHTALERSLYGAPVSPVETSCKITTLHERPREEEKVVPSPRSEDSFASMFASMFASLAALVMLLAAGVFVLLGVMIALFSQNGAFVLEWKREMWSPFASLGILLFGLGTWLLAPAAKEGK